MIGNGLFYYLKMGEDVMKRRITTMFILAFVLMSLAVGCSSKKAPAADASNEEKYIPVEVETAEKKSISNMSVLSGKVFPDKDVMIYPKIQMPAKVIDVKVEVGQKVSEGDLLFVLDNEDIQKQVDQAKAALDTANANYEMNNEKIQNAKLNFERMKVLYEHGAVSKSQYEQAELSASDKALEAARAQADQAQIAYNQALENMENIYVKSPVTGIVSAVNLEVGEMATSAQPIVSVVNSDTVKVQVNVTEDMIKFLNQDQEIKINIDSVSDESFTGRIESISPVADVKTQLYPVEIKITNKGNIIKPGMFAKVSINTDTAQDAIIVKNEAVVEKDGKSYVYVVENDAAVEKEVVVGLDTGELVEIKSGINEGESVIVKGQDYVENGTKVKIVRGEK